MFTIGLRVFFWEFQGYFKSVSRVIQGSLKGLSSKFQGGLRGCQRYFMDISGSFKGVPSVSKKCFKEV